MAQTTPSPSDIFKNIVWDAWVKLAVAKVCTALALSVTGPFGFIIGTLMTFFADNFYAIAVLYVDFAVIKMRNAVHQQQFDNASEQLAIILAEYGPDSKEFADAHVKEQQAFWNLITVKPDPLGVHN